MRSRSRFGPAAWLLATTIALVVAFAGATLYASHVGARIDAMARDIARNADPSIRYLGAARTELHATGRLLTTTLVRHDARAPLASVGEHEERMREELDAYAALSFFPTERARWEQVERAIIDAEAEIRQFEASLASDDWGEAARLEAGPFSAAMDRADVALQGLIAFDADQGARLSDAIERTRLATQRAAFALDAVAIALAALLLAIGAKATRDEVRGLRAARDAETAMTARFEAVAQATVAIAARVTASEPLRDVLQATVDAARSVVAADYAALGVGDDPERPFAGLSDRQPPMGPVLDIPVRHEQDVAGHLYLARKPGAPPFADRDAHAVELLAGFAGAAIHIVELHAALHTEVRAREDLLAIVSHDLRTPLTALTMAARLLQRSNAQDAAAQERVQVVVRNAHRMDRMIGDLLVAAKLHEGRLTIDARPQAAEPLVAEVIDEHAATAASKGIALRTEIAPELPLLYGDGGRIVQVLCNLVGNALKFTKAGGEVVIAVSATDDCVRFAVRDTGIGIADDVAPHVFERYWQKREHASRGTGLGLYIAKGIVDSHNGEMTLRSRLGEGSEFAFTIPAAPAIAQAPGAAASLKH